MKLKLPIILIVVIAVCCLNGCANKRKDRGKASEELRVNIKQDGSKMFSFSIGIQKRRQNESRQGGQGQGNEREQRPSRGSNQSRSGEQSRSGNQGRRSGSDTINLDRLYTALERKLEETNYCTQGYIKIDTHEADNRLHLLGECHDSASEEDRSKFVTSAVY